MAHLFNTTTTTSSSNNTKHQTTNNKQQAHNPVLSRATDGTWLIWTCGCPHEAQPGCSRGALTCPGGKYSAPLSMQLPLTKTAPHSLALHHTHADCTAITLTVPCIL